MFFELFSQTTALHMGRGTLHTLLKQFQIFLTVHSAKKKLRLIFYDDPVATKRVVFLTKVTNLHIAYQLLGMKE